MKHILTTAAAVLIAVTAAQAQHPSQTWNPDKGSHYVNPVLNADYSDPDVCRVGNDFYMTSSSFACFPGLQILHSTDLVNWEIIGAKTYGLSWPQLVGRTSLGDLEPAA